MTASAPRTLGLFAFALLACQRPTASLDLDQPAGEQPAAPDKTQDVDHGAIPSTDVLACNVTLDSTGELLVDGKPIGIEILPTDARVRTFAWDETSVLLALGRSSPGAGTSPSSAAP
ncbi:MAG: hypothetical protein HC927_09980 [Deltaproteobacteria bacterium]|nr:hypothetical protein [Deltaproteobacteria bacterium]